jgi:hypothetical protein
MKLALLSQFTLGLVLDLVLNMPTLPAFPRMRVEALVLVQIGQPFLLSVYRLLLSLSILGPARGLVLNMPTQLFYLLGLLTGA